MRGSAALLPERVAEGLKSSADGPACERLPMVRDVLLHKESNAFHRVLQVTARDFYVMPLGRGAEKAWPLRQSGSLFHLIETGEYLYVPSVGTSTSTKRAGVLPARYQSFCKAFSDVGRLLTPKGRHGLYVELRKDCGKLSSSLFYRLLRRWLEGGMTPSSLKADEPRKHARLEVDETEIRKLSLKAARDAVRRQCDALMSTPQATPVLRDHRADGQPRKRKAAVQPSSFRVDKASLRLFLSYFDAKLKVGRAKPLARIYDEMLEKEFSVVQPLGVPTPFPSYAVPSFKCFECWYYRLTDFRMRTVAAIGSREYELNARAKLGQQVTKAFVAGEAAQIDATIWNVGVVTKEERVFAGFPVVFRIRCVNTGRCLGLGVSLESACWLGAASAIANCLVDKREFCRRYGLEIDAFEWDVIGLPPMLIADCGETYNDRPTRFIERTGVEIVNVKPGRGDLKGGVESDFRTLQVELNGKTPEALIAEHEKRTGEKWACRATMDLDEFIAVLLAVELKRMKRPRKRTQSMRSIAAAGVSTAPTDLWNHLVATHGSALRNFDLSEVQLSLMVVARASITSEGIYFKGMYYREEQLAAAHAFAHARRSGRSAVAVVYDERLVDRIFLIRGGEASPKSYVQCELEDRVDQRGYRGLTFREVRALQELQLEAKKQQHRAEQIRIRQLDEYIETVVDTGTQQTKQARATDPVTVRELIKGMPAARREEANRTSPGQAIAPERVVAPPSLGVPDREENGATSAASSSTSFDHVADDIVFFDDELAAFYQLNQERKRV